MHQAYQLHSHALEGRRGEPSSCPNIRQQRIQSTIRTSQPIPASRDHSTVRMEPAVGGMRLLGPPSAVLPTYKCDEEPGQSVTEHSVKPRGATVIHMPHFQTKPPLGPRT